MKKNCLNCKWLDYYEADYEESCDSGFMCNKREEMQGSEDKLLKALSRDSYREKAKACCELREGSDNE